MTFKKLIVFGLISIFTYIAPLKAETESSNKTSSSRTSSSSSSSREVENDDSISIINTAAAQTTGDPIRGKTLFFTTPTNIPSGMSCSYVACHGNYPTRVVNKIRNGANNGTVIANAITNGTGGMNILKGAWTTQDLADIAAFIANPTVAVATAPQAQVSPTTLTFSGTVGTTSAVQTITLSNPGTASLSITSSALSGTNSAEFTSTAGTGCTNGGTVAAGGSCTYSISFRPTSVGTGKAATLTISHNAGTGSSIVTLSGSATAASTSAITLSANTLDFGNQTVNTASAAKTLTITNSGQAALSLTSFNFTGKFSQASGSTCTTTAAVSAGASCTINIQFQPTTAQSETGTLTLVSNAPGTTPVITLTGVGTAVPTAILNVNPNTLSFGTQTVATTKSQSFVITNTGNANLTVSLSVTGSGFALGGNTCVTAVAPAGTCTVTIGFTPLDTTAISGSVAVTSNGGSAVVGLSGTGSAVPTPAPSLSSTTPLAFAGQVGQTSAAKTVNVVNTGSASYTITSLNITGASALDFIRTGSCQANTLVDVNVACSVSIAYAPQQAGTSTANLVVQTSNGATLNLSLTGSATAAATASAMIYAMNIDFGLVTVGSSKSIMTAISNTGTVPISGITANASLPFKIGSAGNCPATTMPGAQCTIELIFSPTSAGTSSGTLTVTTSATPTPMSVAMTGTGVDVPAPTPTSTTGGTTTPTTSSTPSNAGFGCTMSEVGSSGNIDPTLIIVALAALLAIAFRNKQRN